MYMIDTNIFVDFLRGKLPYGYAALKSASPDMFMVPAMVQAELLLGAEKSARPQANRQAVEELLAPFKIAPFGSDCAYHYAQLRASLERRGMRIGPADMIIAATALAHGAILITNNAQEFQRVPGLSLEAWGEE